MAKRRNRTTANTTQPTNHRPDRWYPEWYAGIEDFRLVAGQITRE